MTKGTSVRVIDMETGESKAVKICDDYVVICDGTTYVAGVAMHVNGNHVITIKGCKPLTWSSLLTPAQSPTDGQLSFDFDAIEEQASAYMDSLSEKPTFTFGVIDPTQPEENNQ